MALTMTGGTDASDDKELDVDDAEVDDDGQAGARDNWLDLDGCRTIEDVRRVVHTRFRTSQQLLDYIQAYKVSLFSFHASPASQRKRCKSTPLTVFSFLLPSLLPDSFSSLSAVLRTFGC